MDASLPSQLQRWIDPSIPKGCLLILAGSSTRMMNDLFLNSAAPLYGRAHKLLHVKPMDYAAFCQACGLKPADMASFEHFSLVGGIPKYWEFVEKGADAITLAEALYFDFAPYMEQEPQRILRDEGVIGANAVSVLEAVVPSVPRRLPRASAPRRRISPACSNSSSMPPCSSARCRMAKACAPRKKSSTASPIPRCASGSASIHRARAAG